MGQRAVKSGSGQKYVLFGIPMLLLFFYTAENPYFWDTAQFGSEHADWYYSHSFRYLLVPDAMDSGHPTTFGMYIALAWTLLGKTLLTSHLAMLPWIVLLVVQAVKLGHSLFPGNKFMEWWTPALLLSQATLLAQSTLVSPDLLLMALFFWALNALLRHRRLSLSVAVLLMGALSMRAMMLGVCLFIFACVLNRHRYRGLPGIFKNLLPFLPGGILGLAFFVYHYLSKGWIGYHEASPWANGFATVGWIGFCKHLIILGWRIVDLGNVFIVVATLMLSVIWLKHKAVMTGPRRNLLQAFYALFAACFLVMALPLCVYQGLLAHRYQMPLFAVFILLGLLLIDGLKVRHRDLLLTLILAGQLSGHFWTYPLPLSQGWDSTLGHLPYYPLRAEFLDYFEKHGLEKSEITTTSPSFKSERILELQGSDEPFREPVENKIETEYLWFSNVNNQLLDYYVTHRNDWEVIKEKRVLNVYMALLKRKP